jgi:hypothetical protein
MRHTHKAPSWLPAWLLSALVAACLVLGCGGGGGGGDTVSAGVGVGGTGGSGRVSGLGSIIVNDVRFDDSPATKTDDGGLSFTQAIALGMVVDVSAGPTSTNANGDTVATARSVKVISAIKGPVQAHSSGAGTLTVLGQSVVTDAATVFSGLPSGLASLSDNVSQVEVYAFYDATLKRYLATRIELLSTTPSAYKVRGEVASLNTIARTFSLGNMPVSYSGLSVTGLSDGQIVRVTLATTPNGATYTAQSVDGTTRSLSEGQSVKIEGLVSQFGSLSNFKVDGTAVNASGSVTFNNGSSADVSDGRRVEAEGTVQGGVLVASKVTIKDITGADVKAKLIGPLTALDRTANTFSLKGLTVTYVEPYNQSNNTGTRIDATSGLGTDADLADNMNVEAEGTLSTDGTRLNATRIKVR